MCKTVILLITISILITLSLGCSCSPENIVGPVVDSVNTVINLSIFEKTSNGLTNLELRCHTDSTYECINYSIESELNITADTVSLAFNDIVKPNICLPATGPATTIINLGTLANNSYEFPLTVNSLTLPAQLILTDSTIEIIGGDSTWTDVVRPVLYRVPANTIWGEVGYNDPLLRDSALTVLNSLASLGAVLDSFSTGHYGYFFIDSTNAIDSILELGPSMGTDSMLSFIYSYAIDTTALSNLVEAYKNQAGGLVKVNVRTSDGYQFKSY